LSTRSSGKVASQDLKATKVKGPIVGRPAASRRSLRPAALRARSTIGVTFRPHSIRGNPRDLRRSPQGHLGCGDRASCNVPIDKVYKFDDIGAAFEHMAANKHRGKIVVTL
jgi:NADPH2:quinone reductase